MQMTQCTCRWDGKQRRVRAAAHAESLPFGGRVRVGCGLPERPQLDLFVPQETGRLYPFNVARARRAGRPRGSA
jgi:hypothetical protein